MPSHSLVRLTNIALRGMTLASKFLLIFFLARFLEPSDLGLYGLLTATIGYALFLLGLDFYTFTTREILKIERNEWGGLLKDQGALSMILYAICLPLLTLIFIQGLLPWSVAGWFFILLILEHLNQEVGRLLIAISEQLTASLTIFLRSGLWALAITTWMTFKPEDRSLGFVLGAWTLGGISALLLGIYKLNKQKISGWKKRINWNWIIKGLKVAIPFVIATLSIRGIFTIDRYWFESLAGLELLGAYVLFMGVCNALLSFLDAGVFAFIYPNLISSYNNKNATEFRKNFQKLLIQTISISVIFTIVTSLTIHPLLEWLGKPIYKKHQSLMYWILPSMILYSISMIPHYALYAQGHDHPIVYSHIFSFLCFIASTWLFSQYWPHIAVPLGLFTSTTLVLTWKSSAFYLLTPKQYRTKPPIQS